MTSVQSLARRIPLVVVGNLTAAAAGIWFQMLIARRLEPKAFGTYAAVITALYALAQVMESHSLSVAKGSAMGGLRRPTLSSLRLPALLGLATSTFIAVYLWTQRGLPGVDIWTWVAAALLLIFWSILWQLRGSAQGALIETAFVSSRSIELWSRLAVGVALLGIAQNLPVVLLAGVIGAGVAAMHMLSVVKKRSPIPSPTYSEPPFMTQLSDLARMAAGYLPLALFIRLDMIVAPEVLGQSELGAYGALNTVGKSVLIYSLALLPLLFPRLVVSRERSERLRIFGFGCMLSLGILTAAAAIFLVSGGSIVRMCFGPAYRLAETMMPFYLLTLVPMALHANVINVQIARGRTASLSSLWAGLIGYVIALRLVPGNIESYLICIAASHTVLSAIGLRTVLARSRTSSPARSRLCSEAGVNLRDRTGRRIESIGSRRAAFQMKSDRLPIARQDFRIRIDEQVSDTIVDSDRVAI